MIVKNESDNVEYEVVYEVVEVTDSDEETSSKNGSDEEVEYEYITEEVEESNDSKEAETTTEDGVKIVVSPTKSGEKDSPVPILMRQPSAVRKSVSFSSVHSILTEDDQVIFVDRYLQLVVKSFLFLLNIHCSISIPYVLVIISIVYV